MSGFLLRVCSIAVLCCSALYADGASVEVTPTSGTLGSIFQYQITAEVPIDGIVDFPDVFQGTSWTVVDEPKVESVTQGEIRLVTQATSITTFDLGRVEIPPAEVGLLSVAGAVRTETVPRQVVWIHSILPDDPQTTLALASVKPVIGPVENQEEARRGYLIAAAIALIVLCVAAILYFGRRKLVSRTPPERFREAIRQLDDASRFDEADPRPYFSELSEALRIYLARAYPVARRDLTTVEMLTSIEMLAESSDDPEEKNSVSHARERAAKILELADRVKFALYRPNRSEYEEVIQESDALAKDTEYIWRPAEKRKKADSRNRRLTA